MISAEYFQMAQAKKKYMYTYMQSSLCMVVQDSEMTV